MSDFTAGFSAGMRARGHGVAEALQAAFAPRVAGFAPADLRQRAELGAPMSFTPQGVGQATGPKHFSPADKAANPTEGWDPFDAHATLHAPAAAPASVLSIPSRRRMRWAMPRASPPR